MISNTLTALAFGAAITLSGFYATSVKAAQPVQCTVVVDAASGETLHRDGTCDKAFAPQSSFKLPLAVMGYDAGILTDATTPRWDYKPEWKSPKRDQKSVDPTIWEKDSVLWYSRELTRKLGQQKFADYVKRFDYGNADVTGAKGKADGLTQSWLMSSLKISPEEQVDFLRRFVNGKLPVSKAAHEKTVAIIPTFEAAEGWRVHGKTGAGRMRTEAGEFDGNDWLGWFVGWADKGDRRVVFATLNIRDWTSEEPISFATRDALITQLPKLVK